jgi:hypothetical protein
MWSGLLIDQFNKGNLITVMRKGIKLEGKTMANPERSADVREEAFNWARLRAYLYCSVADNSPPQCL